MSFSRNGISREFRFIIEDNNTGENTIYDFSFKHQALQEFFKKFYWRATLIDGSDKQKFRYMHYYWTINWSELIVGEDSDKLNEVVNAEIKGDLLTLIPHIDVPWRGFKVFSLKDDNGQTDEIEFSQIVNNVSSAGNKGTIMNFKTSEPHYNWNIADPSKQQSVSAISFEEFM